MSLNKSNDASKLKTRGTLRYFTLKAVTVASNQAIFTAQCLLLLKHLEHHTTCIPAISRHGLYYGWSRVFLLLKDLFIGLIQRRTGCLNWRQMCVLLKIQCTDSFTVSSTTLLNNYLVCVISSMINRMILRTYNNSHISVVTVTKRQ